MLNQNWFMDERFVMFADYGDYQLFYDTRSESIYEVTENITDASDTTIREYLPKNPNYNRLYSAYKSYLNITRLYNKMECD